MKIFNNFKEIKLIGLLLFTVLLVLSCDDVLDEQPISSIGGDEFWKSNKDANLGVTGMYDAMQSTYNSKIFRWGEFRSDNFGPGSESASQDNLQLVYNDLTSGNSNAVRWGDFYRMMNRINLGIKYIPEIPGYDENYLAEAYALRAFAYFDAIRVWGAVPLFLEPIESSTQELQKERTDASVIMNTVVIPDMLMAEELMSQVANKFRFSRTTIWALQAEVYMWLGQYDNAKIVLDKIVASNEYSLVTTAEAWQNMFLNEPGTPTLPGVGKIMTGSELMLSIKYDLVEIQSGGSSQQSGIFAVFFAGLPSFFISPVLEDKWTEKFPRDSAGWVSKYPDTPPVLTTDSNGDGILEPVYGDWRFYLCREGGINTGSRERGQARLAKYCKTNYSPSLDDSDIVLYRYAGILLLLAEAENQLGNSGRALELVNQIRQARQLPLVSEEEFGASTEERENYILDESQLELLGEGKRWWDLRRTDKAIEVLNPILSETPGGVPLTQDRLLFPIFDEHLIENPLLTQNPGY